MANPPLFPPTDPNILDPRVYVPQPGDVIAWDTDITGVGHWSLLNRVWHPISKAMRWVAILTGTFEDDGVLIKDAHLLPGA